jgi:hypothetical protein
MRLIKSNLLAVYVLLICCIATAQEQQKAFRIRTITAGINLKDLKDTTAIISAIIFIKNAEQTFKDKGYEVQTLRIVTQNFYNYTGGQSALSHLLKNGPFW